MSDTLNPKDVVAALRTFDGYSKAVDLTPYDRYELPVGVLAEAVRLLAKAHQRLGGLYSGFAVVHPYMQGQPEHDLVEARKLAGEGSTAYTIAKRLDEAFPAVCRGVKWNPNTVAKILKRRIMEGDE